MKILKSKFGNDEFQTYLSTSDKDTIHMLKLLKANQASLYGLDIETAKDPRFLENKKAGLDPQLSNIRLVQVYDGKFVYVFDVFKTDLQLLKPFLTSNRFIAHNAKFELAHFTHNKILPMNIGCSMLIAMLINTAETSPFEPEDEIDEEDMDGLSEYKRTSTALDAVVARLFKIRVSKENQTSDWNQKELTTEQYVYAALDALLTYKVGTELIPKIAKYRMNDIYQLHKSMLKVLVGMEGRGYPVDWLEHAKLVKIWEKENQKALQACKPFFGDTNLNSPPQMNQRLKKRFKDRPNTLLNWPRSPKGAYTFNRLKLYPYWDMPEIKALLEHKKYSKLLNTYGESLTKQMHPLTKRLHGSFFLGETRTGRMSSRNPNLQNLPKDTKNIGWSIRDAFKAPIGQKFIIADFSQIEIKLGAYLSKDPVMIKAFENGIDLHKYIVTVISGKPYDQVTPEERQLGKAINFGLMFGMRGKKLKDYAAMSYGVRLTELEADKAFMAYHKTYKVYSAWCDDQREKCRKLGFVRTPMGKMRKLLEEELFTRAVNTPVQGGASEAMQISLVKLEEELDPTQAWLISTIHDEAQVLSLNSYVQTANSMLQSAMEYGFKKICKNFPALNICEIGIGNSWGEAKRNAH